MKKIELSEKQRLVLDEINKIVIIGEQKLKDFSDESAVIEAKWQQRAEAKCATAKSQE